MKKKVLSLVLALLMTASAASTVLADDVVAIAEDTAVEAVAVDEEVEAGQYDKAIEFLANYKIFKGYSADDTGAEDLIQRYQMALFVARIATGWTEDEVWEDGPENWSEFSDIDVDPVNKYFGALSFANQKGIIEGYGNGKFGPTDGITYQNALTMVVRTLGYDTLDWPWGYIQKAVELGLTDGITGVAYQDELTRGEVAQIIYNTLFAKMKDGSNLALKNFGIEFGWEKVVITASNTNSFLKLGNDKSTGVEKELVEFKLLNDDGTLGDDAYRALASDFDLDYTKHEDDLAVGNAYYVLFEKDADSALAEIVAVEDLRVDVKENAGKTDDYEDEKAYEIKEFLEDYKIVDKYTGSSYVNVTSSLKPELLVWDVNANYTEAVVNGYSVIFSDDFKTISKLDGDKEEVIWKWSDLLETYYKLKTNDKKEVVGFETMDADELADYLDTVKTTKNETFKGFQKLGSVADGTAYATLELFDTNLDGVADRALFESYKLGKFENDKKWCGSCSADKASYKLSPVGTFEKAINAAKGADETIEGPVYEEIIEGVCDHGTAFFVEGYEPEIAYDEDGEADGYADGYVIYSVDPETDAIKVVKNVDDGSDADSYVATGVLRAYNVGNETITIGEDKLTMNYDELAGTGFYKVNKNAATKSAYTGLLREYFNQFVEYVVVDGELVHIELEGKPSATELIVVDGYKGISADGYIVVNGYSTADADDYTEFRLGSIDGWKKGDAYYNSEKYADDLVRGTVYKVVTYDEAEDIYFVEVLTGKYDYNDAGEILVEGFEGGYTRITTEPEGEYDGYLTKVSFDWDEREWNHDDSYIKLSSKDQWIFVTKNGNNNPYAVINVYTGKLPEATVIEGDFIKVADNNYIVVNAVFPTWYKYTNNQEDDDIRNGLLAALDKNAAGLVILAKDGDDFDRISYNGEDAEDDRYILGGVEYETRAFNVLTGGEVTVGAFNDDFDLGYAYYTQDGVLTDAQPERMMTSRDIVNMVNNLFSEDTIVADYIENIFDEDEDGNRVYAVIGEDKNGEDVTFDELYDTTKISDGVYVNKLAVEAMLLEEYDEIGGTSKYLNQVSDVTYRVIEIDDIGSKRFPVDGIKSVYEHSKLKGSDDGKFTGWMKKDGKDYTDISAFYVYDVEAKDIVIYIVLNDAENVETKVHEDASITAACTTGIDGVKDNEAAIVLKSWADKATLVASKIGYTYTTENDVITEAAITGIDFAFDGEYFEKLLEEKAHDGAHDKATFVYHYGTAAATNTYKLGTCAAGAENYAKISYTDPKGIKVEKEINFKSMTEDPYDAVCNLIKGYKIVFDNLVYIPEDASNVKLTIYIKAASGEYCSYTVELAVVDEVEVVDNGKILDDGSYKGDSTETTTVVNKVLAQYKDTESAADRIK